VKQISHISGLRIWTLFGIHVAQWRTLVNMIMNLRVPQKAGPKEDSASFS